MTAPRTASPAVPPPGSDRSSDADTGGGGAASFRTDRDGVLVESPVTLEAADIAHAMDEARKCGADRVVASIDPDGVLSFAYYRRRPKFERIRRITGYLVGPSTDSMTRNAQRSATA